MFGPELGILIACGATPDQVAGRISDALTVPLDWDALIDIADAQGTLPLLSRALLQSRREVPAHQLAEIDVPSLCEDDAQPRYGPGTERSPAVLQRVVQHPEQDQFLSAHRNDHERRVREGRSARAAADPVRLTLLF
jgi:hypothetical protein